MMSVLTGLYPWSHHVRDHNFQLSPKVALLAERLGNLGYETAAIVPSATLREDFGFARGFDLYSNGRFGHDVITSPALTSVALSWLDRPRKGPFFCWVHLWDPHYNYIPPEPYDTAFPSAFRPSPATRYDLTVLKNKERPLRPEEALFLESQYSGEILYTDRYLGDLLDLLDQRGLRDRTIVVLIGDHGEAFQEHGWLTHTMRVYEEMTRVPLIIRWPGRVPPGKRIETPVSLVNVTPTILDLLGLQIPADEMEGRSLRPLIEGKSPGGLPPVACETIRQAALASLRDGDWKYILNLDSCEGELYDLAADPAERDDLAGSRPEQAMRLRQALLAFYRDRPLSRAVPVVRIETEQPEDAALLRSLGYVSADRFGDRVTFEGRTDPGHCR